MSKLVKSALAFLLVLNLTSCGGHSPFSANPSDQQSSPSDGTDQSKEAETSPEKPENEASIPRDAPSIQASPQTCYTHSNVSHCYELFDTEDVHRAEALYDYIAPGDARFPADLDPVAYRNPLKLFFIPALPDATKIAPSFERREVIWANPQRGHYGFFSPFIVNQLQGLRDRFSRPLIINSGYRSPGYNATLNGAARFSRHTYGDAVDFKIPGVGFEQIARACAELGASFTQIYASHIHCDWRSSPLDENVFGQAPQGVLSALGREQIRYRIQQQSRILTTSLTASRPDHTRLKFQVETITEDPGELYHSWEIYKGPDRIAVSERTAPEFQLKKGTYRIQVKVGGNLELSEELELD